MLLTITGTSQLEMLLIPNALCWSSRKCNCACALPAEVQLRLRVTRRSWQKLFAGKNFVKNLVVTAHTQLRSYSEQQRAFGNSNICNYASFSAHLAVFDVNAPIIGMVYGLSYSLPQNQKTYFNHTYLLITYLWYFCKEVGHVRLEVAWNFLF